ncbi:hypothetical protein SHKM778_07490 [Streptomyces sp. KM77-8]|uniref:DegT/DnrJ/EryC1/StrS aminotransferase family protein n=1 Tax=Streptomyces haneummycinicus TaxID=3074435 RepID=A0AAT9HAG3_9ACTN
MRDRLGRECVYVPSCRFGLYVALRHWCPPGGRVLMSPVNDDVVLFVVLAAGLRPVQAPLHACDGTIDLGAVPDELWGSLSAVLTTNLYGSPDPAPELRARCDASGIPLIEDAAHAIGSEIGGRPVGAWGEASVLSLSKHTGAQAGGILTLADPGLSEAVRATCEELLTPSRPASELAYAVRPYAEAAVRRLGLRRAAWAAMGRLGLVERDGIRMPLRPDALARAAAAAPDLTAYDPWVRVDMHTYRLRSGPLRLRRVRRRLGRLDEVLAACRDGTELLRSTRWARPREEARRSRCSRCRCWSRTGTRRERPSPGAASSSATSTTRPSTTTRDRSSPTRRPRPRRPAGSPGTRCRWTPAGEGGHRRAGAVRRPAGRRAGAGP